MSFPEADGTTTSGEPTQRGSFLTGKRRFLAMPETYILGAGVSEDSRYIALSYHVSSGGYGAAFVRLPKGGYRELVDNGYAMEQIEEGNVPGPLAAAGYRIKKATSARAARDMTAREHFNIIVKSFNTGLSDGTSLMAELRDLSPDTQFIFLRREDPFERRWPDSQRPSSNKWRPPTSLFSSRENPARAIRARCRRSSVRNDQ